MVTIFSTPRPFKGQFDRIQRLALSNWIRHRDKSEIILFDDENGTTAKVAKEYGIKCIKNESRNEFGSLILSEVFKTVRKIAKYKILTQVNTDIILTESFFEGIKAVEKIPKFFMAGQRWNLDKVEVDMKIPDLENKLQSLISKSGILYPITGMDYWVFPKSVQFNMPPLLVGRPGADSWLVYKSREMEIPVIDATGVINIIHHNHPIKYKSKNKFSMIWKEETERNLKLGGGPDHMFSLLDATFYLTKNGLKKPKLTKERLARKILTLPVFYPKLLPIFNLAISLKKMFK